MWIKTVLLTFVFTTSVFVLPGSGQTNTPDEVKKAQQTLKDKGYYKGEVDGIMGPRTRTALRAYQANEKLTTNGRLTSETSRHLGAEGEAPGQAIEHGAAAAKHDYSKGGSDVAHGTKAAGHEIKKDHVGAGAVQMGKGIGRGAKEVGKGTADAAKGVGKGVKDVFDPNRKQ
jgi:peptidoglycan hydrolase-like protein with peptidoglycan-binding domain